MNEEKKETANNNEAVKEKTESNKAENNEIKAEKTQEADNKDNKEKETPDKNELSNLREEIRKLNSELGKSKDELAATNDKYLRMLAEYDNYRRRSQKERESTYSDAYADVITQLLPVIDNFERALSFSESNTTAEGIKLIVNQFNEIIVKLGIESFGKSGEAFDPNLHNAIMHVEDKSYGENTVAEVLQKGYRIGEKILRHAMVKAAN